MVLDVFFAFLLVMFILLGFKDGIVRKLVSIVVMLIGVFVGQLMMRTVGKYLVETFDVDKSSAPMLGFLVFFFALMIGQSFLYRIVAGNYKIGGIADRLIGAALGLAQGALFLSSLLFILAMGGIPSRETTRGSDLYKSVVNLTPEILDFVVTLGPDAQEKLKELGMPDIPSRKLDELKKATSRVQDSLGVLKEEKQKQLFENSRKRPPRQN